MVIRDLPNLLNGRAFQWEKSDSDDKNIKKSMSKFIYKIKQKIEELYTSLNFTLSELQKEKKFNVVKIRFKQVFIESDMNL